MPTTHYNTSEQTIRGLQREIQDLRRINAAQHNELQWLYATIYNPSLNELDIRLMCETVPWGVKAGIIVPDEVAEKKLYYPALAEKAHCSEKTASQRFRSLASDGGAFTYRTEKDEATGHDRAYYAPLPPTQAPWHLTLDRAKRGGSTWEDGKRVKRCKDCGSANLLQVTQIVCGDCGAAQHDPVHRPVNAGCQYDTGTQPAPQADDTFAEKQPDAEENTGGSEEPIAGEISKLPSITVCTGGVGCAVEEDGQENSPPPELLAYDQWVCWRYGAIDVKTGKRKKIPLNPKTGGQARVTAPLTWGTYDEAMSLRARTRLVDGIGFVFSDHDPCIGIDLDGCIDENGMVNDRAQSIITALDSYTEVSPSGKGVHIIARGTLPAAIKTSEVEMYSTGRYFTFTGKQLPGTPNTLEDRQAEITALYERIFAPKKSETKVQILPAQACSLPCADIFALLERGRNDDLFTRLWKGDTSMHAGDESRADMALVRKLAFYLGNDASKIDAAFQQSGLMRPKWHEKRGAKTYGQITIEKVCGTPTVQTKPSPETALAVPIWMCDTACPRCSLPFQLKYTGPHSEAPICPRCCPPRGGYPPAWDSAYPRKRPRLSLVPLLAAAVLP